MNIPVYRAKMIDSDGYVVGFFHSMKWDGEARTEYYITYESLEWEIDPTTLAIHFPNMTDSQANKIFASFSEDGKGGDKFLFDNEIFIIWFDNQSLKINATNKDNFESNCHDSLNEWYDFTNKCYDLKVLGIQE